MKFGIRTPNISKRIKARTTGRVKRIAKKSINPLYGKKGMGIVNDPKKAVYNKVYNKTTVSAERFFNLTGNCFLDILIFPFVLIYYCYKYLFLAIIWIVKKAIEIFSKD